MEPEDLVSVFTVTSPAEAEIVRSSLESVGIPCQIGGETQAGLAGILEIDVLTHADDAEKARHHLHLLKHEMLERKKRLGDTDDEEADEADISEAIQEEPPRDDPRAR